MAVAFSLASKPATLTCNDLKLPALERFRMCECLRTAEISSSIAERRLRTPQMRRLSSIFKVWVWASFFMTGDFTGDVAVLTTSTTGDLTGDVAVLTTATNNVFVAVVFVGFGLLLLTNSKSLKFS